MDKNKQPGIRFITVLLTKLNFELPHIKPSEFKYDFSLKDTYKIEGTKLFCILDISLYDKFHLELTGIFEAIKGEENLSLEKFAEVNAPALLMPYAREVISNITSRTPLPYLLLPPINVLAMKKSTKSKKKITSSK